jgi:hypothetical protein
VAGWAAFGRDFLDRTVRSEPRTHVRLSRVNPTDRKLLTCAERPMKKMPMFAIPIRHGAPGTAPGTGRVVSSRAGPLGRSICRVTFR